MNTIGTPAEYPGVGGEKEDLISFFLYLGLIRKRDFRLFQIACIRPHRLLRSHLVKKKKRPRDRCHNMPWNQPLTQEKRQGKIQ